MKLPEKIKVGYADIAIIPMEHMEGFAHGVYGHFSAPELCIRISTDLDKMVVMNTLVHEILHACYFVGNIEDEDDEEKTVTVLANVYAQVLRDNPEYNKFIQRCIKCK